jgi:glutamyl-tRNA synthetase
MYQAAAEELVAKGHAYRCFCSSERLDAVRKEQEKSGSQQGYDRHCRDLNADEVKNALAEGKPHVVRLKIPPGRMVAFDDLIRGRIEYQSDTLDDLVLLKSDGYPTYHLANIVDDHAMQISHVLRGDEWIASTPRHILLYEAFGWTPPIFAHMPLILDPNGGKLSKRKGAASVTDYKNLGYLPEALCNFLALLGWAPGDDREKMSRDEMIAAFALERITPKPAVFDEKKLEWMNGLYMAESPVELLAPLVTPAWKEKGWIGTPTGESERYVLKVVGMLKERSKKVTDLTESAGYFFVDPTVYEEKAEKKHFKPETAPILKALADKMESSAVFDRVTLEQIYHDHAGQAGLAVGMLIHPTRLAVSGVSFGPGLFELLEALGKPAVIRRMKAAIVHIEKMSGGSAA